MCISVFCSIDGTPQIPTANTVIYSDHFVGNKPIRQPNCPAYIPTIFPTAYKNQKVNSNQQDSRYQRFYSREAVPQSTITSVECNADANQSQSNYTYRKSCRSTSLLDVSDVKEF